MIWSDFPTNTAALVAAARQLGFTADDLADTPADDDEVARWKQVAALVGLEFPAWGARANVRSELRLATTH